MTRTREWILIIYSLSAIFTFGHTFHNQPNGFAEDAKLIGAALASSAWPLYWSVVLWSAP